jgi:hypothetical protein
VSNRNLVLIVGKSASGKTASLRDLRDQPGVIYLNCESGKELPFKNEFRRQVITHPNQVFSILEKAETHDKTHTIVIDSLTYLMDMFESVCVLTASNTMKAWGEYAQYFKKLMQQYVAKSHKNIIFTAHTSNDYNEGDMVMETLVKVKGSLMNQGIESYFNNVIACKKVDIKKLEGSENDLLTITPREEREGFKYVYQTQLTRDTVNERIRGPLGLWGDNETFIDNNLQLVLDRLQAYYA